MKTVKEWFESIKDEDVRQRALACYDGVCPHAVNLSHAIWIGFNWDATDEGINYWYAQMIRAEKNEL